MKKYNYSLVPRYLDLQDVLIVLEKLDFSFNFDKKDEDLEIFVKDGKAIRLKDK